MEKKQTPDSQQKENIKDKPVNPRRRRKKGCGCGKKRKQA
jgi:hypothetical protein